MGEWALLNGWNVVKIVGFTFVVTLFITYFSQFSLLIWLSLSILLFVILAGILFDIIGTAVTAADEAPFHAMGADRVKGSRQAIYLIRNAHTVANFCNDAVGDISGTIGGALVAAMILEFTQQHPGLPERWLSASAIALTAAITVGGKALGKSYAISKANDIVFSVGKLLAVFKVSARIFDTKNVKRKRKPSGNNKKARRS